MGVTFQVSTVERWIFPSYILFPGWMDESDPVNLLGGWSTNSLQKTGEIEFFPNKLPTREDKLHFMRARIHYTVQVTMMEFVSLLLFESRKIFFEILSRKSKILRMSVVSRSTIEISNLTSGIIQRKNPVIEKEKPKTYKLEISSLNEVSTQLLGWVQHSCDFVPLTWRQWEDLELLSVSLVFRTKIVCTTET